MNMLELSPHLTFLQYPGDLADATTLLNDYGGLNAITAIEQEHNVRCKHPWDEILADTLPLSPSLTPRIHTLVTSACENIGLACKVRIFTTHSPQLNAYAFLDRYESPPILSLCLTVNALEVLSDPELLFLIGHELGHIVYEHDRLNLLCHTGENAPGLTVLPFMGEWIFLRWRCKAEISADRVGWLASGQTDAGAGAIIKAATGLTEKNLALDSAAIQAFTKETPAPQPNAKPSDSHSAPLLPVRLNAFYLLGQSAPSNGRLGNKPPAWITKVNRGVDGILSGSSRYPVAPIELASMNLIADAGIELIQSDQEAAVDEIKRVLNILHKHFTDEPDKIICLDPVKRMSRIKSAIRTLNRTATSVEKKGVLSRLADIAKASGPFEEGESKIVLETAAALKIPQHEIYSILVGCIQNLGREVDPGIQSLANKLGTPEAGM
jgi:hypothetical protein